MIHEEARVPPEDGGAPEEDDIFGDGDGDGDGERTEKMDYSKPFRLFDEQGLGVIPVDQFRLTHTHLHLHLEQNQGHACVCVCVRVRFFFCPIYSGRQSTLFWCSMRSL